jgi:hypothetical protein
MWHTRNFLLPIGAAVLLPASLFSAWAQAKETLNASFPTGEGEPLAITCRSPQKLPDSRLYGPKICKTNAEWAQYRKDGMDISADGQHNVPAEKWRSLNTTGCRDNPAGSGATTATAYINLSPVCF